MLNTTARELEKVCWQLPICIFFFCIIPSVLVQSGVTPKNSLTSSPAPLLFQQPWKLAEAAFLWAPEENNEDVSSWVMEYCYF